LGLISTPISTSSPVRSTAPPDNRPNDSPRKASELTKTKQQFLDEKNLEHEGALDIVPSYPWQTPCLQLADYCLWALQRCYEKQECRFLKAIWSRVSLIIDSDDPAGKAYGTYLTRKSDPPNPQKIENRWV